MVEIGAVSFKILFSLILCGLIGLERGIHHKVAGIRTHLLVGLGSTLIVVTSLNIFNQYKDTTVVDPTRMMTGIVTGIGFLCAGCIMRAGSQVMGLTTAATLWIVACIGIAVGAGSYFAAALVTLVVFIVLVSSRSFSTRRRIRSKNVTTQRSNQGGS
ncbi:MAG: MgtC/SapB family protein [Candidatus Omnitrophica bacterium]|nr:MgtC/SapB family protein [Candidatus Omnitrophota bacterium]